MSDAPGIAFANPNPNWFTKGGSIEICDSNEGKPSLNVAFPPPPVTARFPDKAHLPFLYTPCKLGTKGADALPINSFEPVPVIGANEEVIMRS